MKGSVIVRYKIGSVVKYKYCDKLNYLTSSVEGKITGVIFLERNNDIIVKYEINKKIIVNEDDIYYVI